MIHTRMGLARAYGLDLAIFAQTIHDCSKTVGVLQDKGRWILATIPLLNEALFPYWSERHLRNVATEAEGLKLIVMKPELEGIEKKGHGRWLSVDYVNSPLKLPEFGRFLAVDGDVDPEKPSLTPVEEVVAWWNDTFTMLPRVAAITATRVNKTKVRLTEGMGEHLDALAKNILNSEFLLGKSDSKMHWKISFDWLIVNDTNWIKIYEGKYTDEIKTPIKPTKINHEAAKAVAEKMRKKMK